MSGKAALCLLIEAVVGLILLAAVYAPSPQATLPSPTPTATPTQNYVGGVGIYYPPETPELTETPNPTPTKDPQNMTVIWSSNDTATNFTPGGELQVTTGGQCTVVTAAEGYPIYKGTSSFKSEVNATQPSGVIHARFIKWDPIRNYSEAYFGAALYLPSGFIASDWGVNIMQVHAMNDNALGLPFVLLVKMSGGALLLYQYQKTWEGAENMHLLCTAPLGSWFTCVVYLNQTESGHCTVWINGVQLYDAAGDYRTGDHLYSPYYVGGFFDTGIYQSYSNPLQYVLSDEMKVATTYAEALPTPDAPPEPPVNVIPLLVAAQFRR